ncbi:MAG TPA: vitamin K epoxide reductase family protein [Verrucomicrobiota bacterium]|nr:vitamin K epoxide reductase family protein [Verrucomicrobiota bacterium]OQC66987.1 MAG: Vitamin K epoxide reductase family protein [Verrucomicrobia bacterium ADurb.Bin006]HOA62008.1 vitamin K epoxide reductase family protein [Verrucomicrobiota bacterium]HOF49424.1 vitamin K epoxide reductase family protein [Verrucomicrobiota bacterium]HOG88074.1 vitamin K epoxide reductase family protein [Verrucomicrobiota bacterium]
MTCQLPGEVCRGSGPRPLLAVRLLLLVALLGSGYLAWVSLRSGPVPGCGPASTCERVLQSRWAYWLDIPVSIPALLTYAALLGLTCLLKHRTEADQQRGTWAAIVVLSTAIIGAALWFTGLQLFVLHALCKFCMAAHASAVGAAILCLRCLPVITHPGVSLWHSTPEGASVFGMPRRALGWLVLAGVAGVAVLATGQVLVPKRLNVVRGGGGQSSQGENIGAQDASQVPGPPPSVLSPRAHVASPRLLSLYGGSFTYKLDEVPLVGSVDAPRMLVSIFDYTCPHCRELHPLLIEAQRRFSNQLGVVMLLLPLSTNCNPTFPGNAHNVPNACEYARLSLAVWRADRAAFREYDEWLFGPHRPPPVEQARRRAAELVGAEALERALTNEWITQHLHTNAYLHASNWVAAGTPTVPQLVIGPAISSGPLASLRELTGLLTTYLGLTNQP